MGSNVPHQGSNKADALSAELQGRQFNGFGMLTPVPDLVNRLTTHFNDKEQRVRQTKRDRPNGGDLFSKEGKEISD